MSAAKSAPAKKRGLGRGLEALLGPKAAAEAPKLEAAPGDTLRHLPVDALRPGKYQPRRGMDADKLTELSESIKAQGVIQPIVVRQLPDRTFEIIAGERRWRASRQAGLAEIPVVVREVDDRTVVAMALIENIQREDLNPLEEAQALQRLIDEFDLTHAAAAEAVGRSRAAVSNLLRLLELPDEIRVLVRDVPDESAAAMALIENIQREDLNPLEEAQGLSRLVKEFGLTHELAAQAVGRSRSAASNLLRLLNLAEPVQTMLMAGDIDMGHARALLALDRAAQITAGNQIAARKLSVREAEALVKKIGAEFNLVATRPKKEKSRDLKRVEEELSDLLMAEVEVRVKKRVKRNGRMEDMGELSIQFGSLEALNGLIDRLRGNA